MLFFKAERKEVESGEKERRAQKTREIEQVRGGRARERETEKKVDITPLIRPFVG